MVSKVEGMILHTPDTQRIQVPTPNPSSMGGIVNSTVTRTVSQEHNSQLLSLLAQLRDALDKTPDQVLTRNVTDSNINSNISINNKSSSGSGSTGASGVVGGGGGNKNASTSHHDDEDEIIRMTSLLLQSLKGALTCVDLVITKQLLAPLLDTITTHLKSILLPLLKEGISTTPMASNVLLENPSSVDCSRPVQAVLKILPEILRVHLFSLASCPPVACAIEELGFRVLHLYVTIAALVRYALFFCLVSSCHVLSWQCSAIQCITVLCCSLDLYAFPYNAIHLHLSYHITSHYIILCYITLHYNHSHYSMFLMSPFDFLLSNMP